MFKKIIFTLLISFLSCSLLAEEYIHYQVKKKDYLSSILYSLDIAPIYGKKGYLKKVIALNKKKVKKHGDVILEGTDLLLPLSVASKVLAANIDDKIKVTPSRAIAEIVETKIAIEPIQIVEKKAEAQTAVTQTTVEPIKTIIEQTPRDDLFQQKSFFKLSPTLSILGIGAIDSAQYGHSDITDSTKPSVGIYGEWRILITPDAEAYVFSSLNSLSFYGDSSYGLKDTHFLDTSFGVGNDYKLNSLSKLSFNAQVNQNYFLEVINPTNIQIQSLSQVELNAKFKKVLFSIDRVQAEGGLGTLLILPSTRGKYKSELGYGYRLDMITKFLSKEIEFSYTQKYYKINSSHNQSQEVQAQLNFAFDAEK
jgi:hypothetical protein